MPHVARYFSQRALDNSDETDLKAPTLNYSALCKKRKSEEFIPLEIKSEKKRSSGFLQTRLHESGKSQREKPRVDEGFLNGFDNEVEPVPSGKFPFDVQYCTKESTFEYSALCKKRKSDEFIPLEAPSSQYPETRHYGSKKGDYEKPRGKDFLNGSDKEAIPESSGNFSSDYSRRESKRDYSASCRKRNTEVFIPLETPSEEFRSSELSATRHYGSDKGEFDKPRTRGFLNGFDNEARPESSRNLSPDYSRRQPEHEYSASCRKRNKEAFIPLETHSEKRSASGLNCFDNKAKLGSYRNNSSETHFTRREDSNKSHHISELPKTAKCKNNNYETFSETSTAFIGPLYQPSPPTVALGKAASKTKSEAGINYELQQFYKELDELEAVTEDYDCQGNAPPSTCQSNAPPSSCQSNAPPSSCQSNAPPGSCQSNAPPGSCQSNAPPGSCQSNAPPGSCQSNAPPGSCQSNAPPGSCQSNAPPGSFQGSGPPGSFQGSGPPGSFQGSGPPGSFQGSGPPGSYQGSGPPGSYQGSGPPGSYQGSGPPGSFQGSGPPGSFQGSGPPGSFQGSGPPGSFQGSGPPGSFQGSGPPGSFQGSGPPGSFQGSGPPGSFQGSGPPGSFQGSGPPGSFQGSGPPGSFQGSGPPGSFQGSGPPGSFQGSGPPGSFQGSGPPGSFQGSGPPGSFQGSGPPGSFQGSGPPGSFQGSGPPGSFQGSGPPGSFQGSGPPGAFQSPEAPFPPSRHPALPPINYQVICNRPEPFDFQGPPPQNVLPSGSPPQRYNSPFPKDNHLRNLPYRELEKYHSVNENHPRPATQMPWHNSHILPDDRFSPQSRCYSEPLPRPSVESPQDTYQRGDFCENQERHFSEIRLPQGGNLSQEKYPPRFRDEAKCTESRKKLVLLRGVPGSGKSTLARTLLEQSPDGIIFSTDDYFCQENGYTYDVKLLGDAHTWNQNRARRAMDDGRSPIIIDNTNIQSWEMKPYVQMAIERGYGVDFLEPNTWWKVDPHELEKRNTHRVPRDKITQMLERFEHDMNVAVVMNSVEPRRVRSRRPPPEAQQQWGASVDCMSFRIR